MGEALAACSPDLHGIYSRNLPDTICASNHAENIIHAGHLLEAGSGTNSGNMSGLSFPCPSDLYTDCLANREPVGSPQARRLPFF